MTAMYVRPAPMSVRLYAQKEACSASGAAST
jgi:hypothetical protein